MAFTPDTLSTAAARDQGYPVRVSKEMEHVLKLVKTYVDALSPETLITTRGDLIRGIASGVAARYALGTAGHVLVSDGTDLVWGAMTGNALLADGTILIGNGSNVATGRTLSGDVTVSNTGVTAIGADKVTVAQLNNAAMAETATVSISQAQMLALSTPVELVAAPGAGKVIVVDEIEILHTYSTAAYATGSDVSIEYATSGDNVALIADTFFQATASATTIIKPSSYDLDASTGTASGFDVTANANKAVQMTASNFTNGNAANIFKVRVRYHVRTLMT